MNLIKIKNAFPHIVQNLKNKLLDGSKILVTEVTLKLLEKDEYIKGDIIKLVKGETPTLHIGQMAICEFADADNVNTEYVGIEPILVNNEEIEKGDYFQVNGKIHQCIGFNEIGDIESTNNLCYDKNKCVKVVALPEHFHHSIKSYIVCFMIKNGCNYLMEVYEHSAHEVGLMSKKSYGPILFGGKHIRIISHEEFNFNEDFVPYELALALKQLGYNPEIYYGWYSKSKSFFYHKGDLQKHFYDEDVKAPLYQQAFKWFYSKTNKWIIPIPNDDKKGEWYAFGVSYKTFQEAQSECLKKLIEFVKKK